MDKVLNTDNLCKAYQRGVKNKGTAGIDGMKYTELKECSLKNGEDIINQIETGKYRQETTHNRSFGYPFIVTEIHDFIQEMCGA